MTPDELENHIASCANLVEICMRRYALSNNFADRGEADFWRMKMETAIQSRTPETVAKMEMERGLA